ncbi:Nitrite reductase [NAD(P)H] large subunit [Halanaerobium saccharolyticum subsp. saccharolyticum DSM 6643]|uniref:Nitrite reductase [NAD(P)H] large subunit n=1 Tax=Halanaerobium saccharolyticum subsp. saccharolyticum DSM 6643 TaxID=1293054 RepID=M5E0T7_9FIRM|nr:FAD-dependent oxidoreductase [Halanaerobium saccharolyticum]CCU79342.1 Nitrite reductase [NAD(P)H] large subunit [Halanaerobium saccharolyticum subsp. saccharolyticum DSM 6643]
MDYLIIGAGAAGVSAAKEILKNRKKDDKISIFTDENYPFYYRPRLIECLSGEVEVEEIIINDEQWFEDNNINLHLGEKITEVDLGNKVIKSNSDQYNYDKLLLANGSHCFVPPFSGMDLENIFTLRTAADLKVINKAAEKAKKAVVVGGGLLGLEIAYNFAKAGLDTTVLEVAPYLLPMQLDKKGGDLLEEKLKANDVKVITDATTKGFDGQQSVEKVVLEDQEIEADLVLISTGVRSNTSLIENLDIEINNGVKVNSKMQTSNPDVYAAGDVAEYEGEIYGIWPPSLAQGRVAGTVMSGGEAEFDGYVRSHKLKVAGINVVSLGELNEEGDYEEEIIVDNDTYVKVIKDNGDKIGVLIVGQYSEQNQKLADVKR